MGDEQLSGGYVELGPNQPEPPRTGNVGDGSFDLGLSRTGVEGPTATALESGHDAPVGRAEAEQAGRDGQEPFEIGVDGMEVHGGRYTDAAIAPWLDMRSGSGQNAV